MTALVVLASRSTARAALLRAAGLEIEVADAGVDEAALKRGLLAAGTGPAAIAASLAEAKAAAASAGRAGLVVGADQTLDLDGVLFDKPADLAEARDHLRRLRGRTHRLHAAVAAAEDGVVVWREVQHAALHVRAFSDAFLEDYVSLEGEALLGSVGGYRLEGRGVQLFERIEGDYFTILGLPLLGLLAFLRQRGVAGS